jgi:hypothetical protein
MTSQVAERRRGDGRRRRAGTGTIGLPLSEVGYFSEHNLTARPGPLIATRKHRDLEWPPARPLRTKRTPPVSRLETIERSRADSPRRCVIAGGVRTGEGKPGLLPPAEPTTMGPTHYRRSGVRLGQQLAGIVLTRSGSVGLPRATGLMRHCLSPQLS